MGTELPVEQQSGHEHVNKCISMCVCVTYPTCDLLDQSEIVTPSLEHNGHLHRTRSRREAGENQEEEKTTQSVITFICINIHAKEFHNVC